MFCFWKFHLHFKFFQEHKSLHNLLTSLFLKRHQLSPKFSTNDLYVPDSLFQVTRNTTIDMMLIAQRSALIFELNKENCFFLKQSFYICRKYKNSPSKKTGSKKNASDVLWFWLASYEDKVKKSRRINEKTKNCWSSHFEWPFCKWEYIWYMQLSYQFSTLTGFDTWLPALLATGLVISRIY